ncbi:HAD family hydrolase [Oceanobacillus caeni]|uniref:HAD family hydrolase n=1 Tax=Oceanobacillus caeni TaxID=405946 RepID=UPI0036263FAE
MDTIIFDVDDTLYDQAMSFKNTCRRMFDRDFTEEELNQFYMISRKYSDALFDRCEAGEMTVQEMHIRRIKNACLEMGMKISDQESLLFQDAYVEEQHKITLFPESEKLLEYLHEQGKQLAILTNGSEDHQSMKVKQLNVSRWIPEENTFISGAIGHAKPTGKAFQILEEKLGLDKEKTVYVGDSFDNDMVGAKQAGWNAVWMNHRRRKARENSVKPDKIVYSATELLELFVE